MQVSIKWLHDYIDFTETAEELADKLTMAGIPVENVIRADEGLEKVVTGKVENIVPHPDSDHMFITTMNVGGAEPVQIVTGAQNVHQDDCSARAEKHIGHTLADPGARFVRERAEKRQQEQREDVVRRHYHARIGLVELEGICKEQWNDAVVHLPESADGQERKSRQYGSFVVKFHMTPPILVSE